MKNGAKKKLTGLSTLREGGGKEERREQSRLGRRRGEQRFLGNTCRKGQSKTKGGEVGTADGSGLDLGVLKTHLILI